MEYIREPKLIENKSMDIIEGYLANCSFEEAERPVVKRIIHATGDPEFASLVLFGPRAATKGILALSGGGKVFCDVEMVRAGINRRLSTSLGLETVCRIHDEEIKKQAEALGVTRASAAMLAALETVPCGGIFVIGNAPTALFTLLEAVEAGRAEPALVVGTPVGFVGAAEAKAWLAEFEFPWVTVRGNKGGSAVAVSALNALLAQAAGSR